MYVDLSVCLVGSTARTRPVRQAAVSVHRQPYIIHRSVVSLVWQQFVQHRPSTTADVY